MGGESQEQTLKPEVLATECNAVQQLGIVGHVQTRGLVVEARKFQKAQRAEECEGEKIIAAFFRLL